MQFLKSQSSINCGFSPMEPINQFFQSVEVYHKIWFLFPLIYFLPFLGILIQINLVYIILLLPFKVALA